MSSSDESNDSKNRDVDRDFSEDDHLADILGKLRASLSDDFALEEYVWTDEGKKRKDIVVRRLSVLVVIIEVKRPAKFATSRQKDAASAQVIQYARSEGCRNVAWTDGDLFISKDLITEKETVGNLLGVAQGVYGWEARQEPTFLRPQWTSSELLLYPERQRDLHVRLVEANFLVERDLPNGPLSRILASPATLHVIYGESDVGKSTLARATADSSLWSAIYLEPILFVDGIDSALASEVANLYGRMTPMQAFIERVHEVSLQESGKQFGIVIDGFDEWTSNPGSQIGSLTSLLQRVKPLGIKVIVFSRPNERSRLSHASLRGFMSGESAGELDEMNDAELDATIALWFPKKGIGGTLTGNAREICRNPGICWLVAETYENKLQVDSELTEPTLYNKYHERMASKLEALGRLQKSQFQRAIERVAIVMLEREHFALPYEVAADRAGGAGVLDLLINERILQQTTNSATSPVRFRHGQFRNYIFVAAAQNLGIPASRLARGIEAIRRSEGAI